ncbi:MAG: nucleotidyltransferase family protein [Anaerolineales bacterium]|uniref:nucleotidyltransferase family protein n=1 Tax=Candidatus Villigracilis affinis TaxID=3140682 RepID=UPI001B65C282|nr:nucleotidyltransferase family protein [Anaerolineales bacterium]MBL0345221.1 nucleotidyltransferase family protein [Anaerolineales bacterium]MBP8047311.1 nucleotidyltransferase family protein [Anaerolineales bacterium]
MDIIQEMHRLIDAANAKNIQLRAIGGLAVQAHNKKNHPLFLREFADLDFVVAKKQRREFEAFMPEVGYAPHRQFNVLNGDQRQIYYHNESEMKIDIFVGDFMMCHKIPLENRLKADPITIPLAELLLSKAQIVHLNRKDALDIASLFLNTEVGMGDDEVINLSVIAALCGSDWGLYKTTSINLERVKEVVSGDDVALNSDERALIVARVDRVLDTFNGMQKSLAWQMRDKVGTRVRWYEEVEEVAR